MQKLQAKFRSFIYTFLFRDGVRLSMNEIHTFTLRNFVVISLE